MPAMLSVSPQQPRYTGKYVAGGFEVGDVYASVIKGGSRVIGRDWSLEVKSWNYSIEKCNDIANYASAKRERTSNICLENVSGGV